VFVLVRAVTYASLFIGFLLVFLPARILSTLSTAGVEQPPTLGVWQFVGIGAAALGAVLALACIFTFAFVGKGTPAPFDPPRRLVVRGPYTIMRNPMYLGAGLALAGAALVYQSWLLAAYAGLFLVAMHLFVVAYEEPTLRQTFGSDYDAYCRRVNRWLP
jgi:protein-S-isoprenylcysteine O-methyltransferase Ste14